MTKVKVQFQKPFGAYGPGDLKEVSVRIAFSLEVEGYARILSKEECSRLSRDAAT